MHFLTDSLFSQDKKKEKKKKTIMKRKPKEGCFSPSNTKIHLSNIKVHV